MSTPATQKPDSFQPVVDLLITAVNASSMSTNGLEYNGYVLSFNSYVMRVNTHLIALFKLHQGNPLFLWAFHCSPTKQARLVEVVSKALRGERADDSVDQKLQECLQGFVDYINNPN